MEGILEKYGDNMSALVAAILAYQWIPIVQLMTFETTVPYFAIMPLHTLVGGCLGILFFFVFAIVNKLYTDYATKTDSKSVLIASIVLVTFLVFFGFTILGWEMAPQIYYSGGRTPNYDEIQYARLNLFWLAVSGYIAWALLYSIVWFLSNIGDFSEDPLSVKYVQHPLWKGLVYLGVLVICFGIIVNVLNWAQMV